MAEVIDGRAIARALDEQTKAEVEAFVAAGKNRPGLTVILVGDDPASEVYVRHKVKACERVGMRSTEHRLPAKTTQKELLGLIDRVNASEHVHGILVQVPLPDHIDERAVIDAIDPAKDVDGFHPVNVGRLSTGTGGIWPCTPFGCIKLLHSVEPDLTGLDALVIGRSNIVGKPVAMMLMARNATVTMCHSRTKNLPEVCAEADILIAATGRAEMIDESYVKEGAVVIDVGISRMGKKLTGDVAYDRVADKAGWITPVPGGVGPMTRAMLLVNTMQAAKLRVG